MTYKTTFTFLKTIALGCMLSLLVACGGGGGETQNSEPAPNPGTGGGETQTDTTWQSSAQTVTFLNRATFGAKPTDLNLHQTTTASDWFEAQLNVSPTYLMQSIQKYTRPEDYDEPSLIYMASTSFAFWQHAISAEDQLRQRVAFALSEILVTSTNSGDELAEHAEAMASYQDLLIKHAFGNYRDLLTEVTYSPAMGFYLTYMGNEKGNEATGKVPDENYARELLQLFTIGVEQLNMDGSTVLNSSNDPIETYSNTDIQGLARVFTGLNLDEDAHEESVAKAFSVPMWVFDEDHSLKEKTFLGQTIPANTYTEESIEQALDVIFNHQNVAPFVGKQLIQRLVSSNPSSAYIERVALAFESGVFVLPNEKSIGAGRRGDLAATVAAVLFDEEALNPNAQQSGKVREPIIRFTHWARAFNVSNIRPEFVLPLWDTSSATRLGQHPYRSPSVFNFFRPGYAAPGSMTAENNLVAPELQITNATSIPGYINFMTYFIAGLQQNVDIDEIEDEIEAEGLDLDADDAPTSFLVTYELALNYANDANALVDYLNLLLTGNQISQQTVGRIVETISNLTEPEQRVKIAVLMMMTSADYLVQQ